VARKLSDYEKYIRTEDLLNLQKSDQELCCEDELTFQVVHQIAELHFKLIIHYLNITIKAMETNQPEEAKRQLQRVNIHLSQLPAVFNMVKVIDPIDYHTIRLSLGQGSGQDSPGFNQVLKLGPTLWPPFQQLLKNQSLTALDLHKKPETDLRLFQLMQELHQFDENFQNFRHHHLQLVKRMIGLETNSLKGIPAKMLQKGVGFEFYPELWTAISELTDWTGSSYHAKPLDD
jgi:tryptophan 2,3-dioxygenase